MFQTLHTDRLNGYELKSAVELFSLSGDLLAN